MKKIMIVGANGQLGRAVSLQFQSSGNEIIRLTHGDLNICDADAVSIAVGNYRPDLLINCAAYNKVDLCEKPECYSLAYQINVNGCENLARSCDQFNAEYVYVSTDYVFDGTASRPIEEDQKPNPINQYGKTKLMGEQAALRCCERSYVVRTAWLYGDGLNFVKTMLRLSAEHTHISVVDDQFGTPTSAAELAKVIQALTSTASYGITHATNEGLCSWYDFARSVFKMTGKTVTVESISSDAFCSPAKRPAYSVLENKRLKQMGINYFSRWEDALACYLEGYRQ